MSADQRNDLVDRHEKGHGVDHAQQAKDYEAGEPIGWRVSPLTKNDPGFAIHFISCFHTVLYLKTNLIKKVQHINGQNLQNVNI
ncbi:MAG TPA: hypothetical protein VIM16_11590 [Mucilaginibacter sp.]